MVENSNETEKRRNGETGIYNHRFTRLPIHPFVLGIKAQLIIGIAVVTVGAIALIGFLSIKMLEWNAIFRKGKEAEVIVTAIKTFIQEKEGTETKRFRDFVASITEKGLIKGMTIMDGEGKVFFVTGQELFKDKNEGKLLFSLKELKIRMAGGGWFKGVGRELIISAPIHTQDARLTTQDLRREILVFSMPLADIKEESSNFRNFIFFYAFFDSLIIIALGTYLFSRGIIRPMAILKETAESIASGRLEQRVNIKASNEIGSFASSFNIMTDRLEEKIKTLERLNKELTAMQEGLIRSEKLATVGRLSAGIAHEIGNPLGALLGYVGILKKGTDSKEAMEITERLEKEIIRIDSIVRRLLDFSRPSKGAMRDVDVNSVIKNAVAMLSPQFSAGNISVDMKLDEDIYHIVMDEGMLQQVMLNLFLNAKDAMERGGTITVETSETSMSVYDMHIKKRKGDLPDNDYKEIRSKAERKYVKISVADTGKGIDRENLDKIFDPFFTSKEAGKGTGLGLTVSLGIIQAYGGDIKVNSEPQKGTTFEVLIPREQEIGKRK